MEQDVNKHFIRFYIELNPYFGKIQKISDTITLCTSDIIKEVDSNVAVIKGNVLDLGKVEAAFAAVNKVPAVYEIDDQFAGCKELHNNYAVEVRESWLFSRGIKKLRKKFARVRVPAEICLEEVNDRNEAHFRKVTDLGFSTQSADNPYSHLESDWTSEMFNQKRGRLAGVITPYLIKYGEIYAGAVISAVCESTAYVHGFTILPEYRRTKAITASLLLIDKLIEQGVDTVLCATATGGYPEQLYKKMGLRHEFSGKIYKKKS